MEETRKEQPKQVEKVVKSNVTVKKKSTFEKLFDPDDMVEIKNYLVYDVVIPSLKDLLFDAFTNGLSMSLFHEQRRPSSRGRSNGGYVPYNRAYNQPTRDSRNSDVRRAQPRRYDYENIIFDNYADADEVLREMEDTLKEYPFVTVGHFKQLSGIETISSDFRHGWTDLRNATIDRTREGDYVIRLPKALEIN